MKFLHLKLAFKSTIFATLNYKDNSLASFGSYSQERNVKNEYHKKKTNKFLLQLIKWIEPTIGSQKCNQIT